MALPRKLKNFNLFVDGDTFVGICSEVVLPKLTRKLEDYRGGGMNGPVKLDMGMNGLELEFTTGFDARIFRTFAKPGVAGVQLRWVGAYQRDDTGEVAAVEVAISGRSEEIDSGTAKAGDDAPTKVKVAATYYKLTIDGTVEVEIDLVNFIETVGGEDRLADQRKAIGV